jgi:MFS family permease
MAVGVAMLSLSLGWSLGALAIGQTINRIGKRPAAIAGAFCLIAGAVGTLFFTTATGMVNCFVVFFISGTGMGFVTLSTLMVVQNSLPPSDLGVATSTHQFARTLGGTIGVGISGSLMTWGLSNALTKMANAVGGPQIPAAIFETITQNLDNLLRPGLQDRLAPEIRLALQEAVSRGSDMVFWCALAAALACLVCCLLLPREEK